MPLEINSNIDTNLNTNNYVEKVK